MKDKLTQSTFLSMMMCLKSCQKMTDDKYSSETSESQDLTDQKLVLFQYLLIESSIKIYPKMMRTVFWNRKSSNFHQQQHIRSSDLKNQLFCREIFLRKRIASKSARRATKMKQRRRVLRNHSKARKLADDKYGSETSESQDLTNPNLVFFQYFLIESSIKIYPKIMRTVFWNRKSSNFH